MDDGVSAKGLGEVGEDQVVLGAGEGGEEVDGQLGVDFRGARFEDYEDV